MARRTCILSVVAIAAISMSVAAQQPQTKASFEVATVKPHPLDDPLSTMRRGASCHGNDSHYPPSGAAPPPLGRCLFIRMPLSILIRYAFTPIGPEVLLKINGGPSWVNTDLWDIEAKSEDSTNPSEAELQRMMQSLLAERFKLQIHREAGEAPGFALLVAKGGLKMKPDEKCDDPGQQLSGQVFSFKSMTLTVFARFLGGPAGGTVADKTALTGCYSFSFEMPPAMKASPAADSEDGGPSLFTTLQNLGLRLEAQKIPMDFIVIDSVQKPTAN